MGLDFQGPPTTGPSGRVGPGGAWPGRKQPIQTPALSPSWLSPRPARRWQWGELRGSGGTRGRSRDAVLSIDFL